VRSKMTKVQRKNSLTILNYSKTLLHDKET